MRKEDASNNYINRELSWVEFNERVLEEAQDNSNPLFERLKFEAIVSSNLDEFFMVRVGSLHDQIAAGFHKQDPSGLSPEKQLEQISIRVHKLVYDQCNCFNRSLKPSLRKEGIEFIKPKELDSYQMKYIEEYYVKNIYPVLTPMIVDNSRPFPLILNRSLNIAILLKSKKEKGHILATVQVPSVLDRLISIPDKNKKLYILLEDVISMNLQTLFSGHDIIAESCYRITRNADLTLDEEGAEDLLEAIEQSLKQRKWGSSVRLEIEPNTNKKLLNILIEELEIEENQIYVINTPIDLTFLTKLSKLSGFDNLCYKEIEPLPSRFIEEEENLFEAIKKKDILLHHPYESFDPIVKLVKIAAKDPDVLAIKQTLYRVSGNSPIVEALVEAAENGKQVTVLVELKARFDEKNNIHWAKRLEESGCHVIYGIVGLKTHCKLLLVVRREKEGIKRYVHMGTGNYNDVTAHVYTDLGLFTANEYFGSDASSVFNMLSGHSQPTGLYKMCIAPIKLRKRFLYLINKETENAKKGKKAKIIAKMNSLVDKEIIEALYAASNAGVSIELIVRGICCLRPGIRGVSENIIVRSIVGRFLEHSRIYYFYNMGEEEIYLSSADWMTRNLDRRVELLFPVEDNEAVDRLKNILEVCLKDTEKTRILNPDGTYSRIDKRGKEIVDCQTHFYDMLIERDKEFEIRMQSLKAKDVEQGFTPVLSERNQ